MPGHDGDQYEGGEAWADILARRSPEGRTVVERLNRAEEAALAIQERVALAIIEKRDVTDDLCAFDAALTEVERMRSEVYHMARQ
jgi:hypothetical protein